jgi:hypothetical protein
MAGRRPADRCSRRATRDGASVQLLRMLKCWCAFVALSVVTLSACALEVRFVRVAEGVYAHIGDKGGRTADNEGLNANLGLVLTSEGAVLIDSGATSSNARRIHDAIRRVTDKPVRWVINTGTQDHRWFGNGYFQSIGAELIAHGNGLSDMRSRGGDQLAQLRSLNIASVDDTRLALPEQRLAVPHHGRLTPHDPVPRCAGGQGRLAHAARRLQGRVDSRVTGRQDVYRSAGHAHPGCWQGRRLDQGRQRHAVRCVCIRSLTGVRR